MSKIKGIDAGCAACDSQGHASVELPHGVRERVACV